MQIEFKVDYHTGTDRRTLKIRLQNDINFSDCKGALFANDGVGAFYRAVALLLNEHHVKADKRSTPTPTSTSLLDCRNVMQKALATESLINSRFHKNFVRNALIYKRSDLQKVN